MSTPNPFASFLTKAKTTLGKKNSDLIYDPRRKIDWIPTGVLAFDLAMGGGVPRRRLVEIYGMEHSGKTSVTLNASGIACKGGLNVLFIDAEHAYDPGLGARTYGVPEPNQSRFALVQPVGGEEVCDIVDMLLHPQDTTKIDLLILDSIDACKPKSLIDSSASEEARVGAHPRLMGLLVAKLRALAAQKNCAVVMINQMRAKIQGGRSTEQNTGTAAGFNVMEQHTTPGGYAPRFYSSIRVKMEYGGAIQDENHVDEITNEKGKARIGNQVKIINVKNKCAPPFRKVVAPFLFPNESSPNGWDNVGFMIDVLKKRGRIQQRGTRFEYHGLNKNFSNIGSIAASMEKFSSDAELVKDAEELLFSLLAPKSATDGPNEVVQIATPAEINDGTQNDEDPEVETLSLGSISLEDTQEAGVNLDEPVTTVSL